MRGAASVYRDRSEPADAGTGAPRIASDLPGAPRIASDLPEVPPASADPRRKAGERPPSDYPPEITAAT